MTAAEVSREGLFFVDAMQEYANWRGALDKIEGIDPSVPVPTDFNPEARFKAAFSHKEPSFTEKLAEAAFQKAVVAFVGDQSIANIIAGKRIPLTTEDRALALLSVLSQRSTERDMEWATVAVLDSGYQQGLELEDVHKHMVEGVTNLVQTLSKIPLVSNMVKKGDREKAIEDAEKEFIKISQLWGDSPEALQSRRKQEFDKLWFKIQDGILKDSDLQKYVSSMLQEIAMISPNSYKPPIDRAREMFVAIPKGQELLPHRQSKLARTIVLKHAISQAEVSQTPENHEELLTWIVNQTEHLRNLDFVRLADNVPEQLTQVNLRASILTGISRYIDSPQVLLICAESKIKIEHALSIRAENTRKYPKDLGIYRGLDPEYVASIVQKVREGSSELARQNITPEELQQMVMMSSLYSILEESHEDMFEAKSCLWDIITGLQSKDRKYIPRLHMDQEPEVLRLLRIEKASDPRKSVSLNPEQRRQIALYFNSIPEYHHDFTYSSSPGGCLCFIGDVFSGEVDSGYTEGINDLQEGIQKLIRTYLSKVST